MAAIITDVQWTSITWSDWYAYPEIPAHHWHMFTCQTAHH